MREHVLLEIATLLAGIVALCTFESFLTGVRENVLLEIASLFTKIVALSAFEGILPESTRRCFLGRQHDCKNICTVCTQKALSIQF